MAQSREFYIPANSRKVASKKASAVVYVYESAAGSVPMAFISSTTIVARTMSFSFDQSPSYSL